MGRKIRIGALISGGGTNLQAIIDACNTKAIDGEIVFVGTDRPDAYGLKRAQQQRIPTFVVDFAALIREFRRNPDENKLPTDYNTDAVLKKQHLTSGKSEAELRRFLQSRAVAESELLKAMTPYPFDLLVLAGFMRNLTPYFIDAVNREPEKPRIMNIHPALLPAFPGTDGYGDTFRYGCKVGGCTVHFIDYGEDSGPIIGQRSFVIEAGDTLDDIKKKGLALEWQLYPEAIQLFAEGRLELVRPEKEARNGERTVVRIADSG